MHLLSAYLRTNIIIDALLQSYVMKYLLYRLKNFAKYLQYPKYLIHVKYQTTYALSISFAFTIYILFL